MASVVLYYATCSVMFKFLYNIFMGQIKSGIPHNIVIDLFHNELVL